jgi:DNA-binding Lrp family transcriptional regulator
LQERGRGEVNTMNKEVLKVLEKDARATPEQIANMTGLSVDEVEKTIDKAERDKVILKYKTVINWERLGEEWVQALIEVKIQPQRNVGFDAIAERIYRFPEVRSVYLVSGTYDLAVLVVGKTMREAAAFVWQKLATLESVQGTVTHFLLKSYKEDGEILDGGGEKGRRQPLTL